MKSMSLRGREITNCMVKSIIDFNMCHVEFCKYVGSVPITFDEEKDKGKDSNTQHDRPFEVDYDLMRTLQDKAFMDHFFMDLFSSDHLNKERFEKDSNDDE